MAKRQAWQTSKSPASLIWRPAWRLAPPATMAILHEIPQRSLRFAPLTCPEGFMAGGGEAVRAWLLLAPSASVSAAPVFFFNSSPHPLFSLHIPSPPHGGPHNEFYVKLQGSWLPLARSAATLT